MLIGHGYLVEMKPEGRSRWTERGKEAIVQLQNPFYQNRLVSFFLFQAVLCTFLLSLLNIVLLLHYIHLTDGESHSDFTDFM